VFVGRVSRNGSADRDVFGVGRPSDLPPDRVGFGGASGYSPTSSAEMTEDQEDAIVKTLQERSARHDRERRDASERHRRKIAQMATRRKLERLTSPECDSEAGESSPTL